MDTGFTTIGALWKEHREPARHRVAGLTCGQRPFPITIVLSLHLPEVGSEVRMELLWIHNRTRNGTEKEGPQRAKQVRCDFRKAPNEADLK